MKKAVIFILVIALCLCGLCACSGGKDDGKIDVVCTVFPIFDWVSELTDGAGEDINVDLLLNNGVDLHSYQPTVADIVKISSCDLFIYVGGESDAWVEDALKNAKKDNVTAISLMEVLGDKVKEEEITEGMQGEADEGAEEAEYDEHVWLSLKNAELFCGRIAEALKDIDADNADKYEENKVSYCTELQNLDAEYKQAVDEARFDTLVFADRFPFRYLTDDYGLTYFAAFPGCSAETEASFETVLFLANKVDSIGLKCVLTLETASQNLAATVVQNTAAKNQSVYVLDSMQSVTADDVASGATYIKIMQSNLGVLKNALN